MTRQEFRSIALSVKHSKPKQAIEAGLRKIEEDQREFRNNCNNDEYMKQYEVDTDLLAKV